MFCRLSYFGWEPFMILITCGYFVWFMLRGYHIKSVIMPSVLFQGIPKENKVRTTTVFILVFIHLLRWPCGSTIFLSVAVLTSCMPPQVCPIGQHFCKLRADNRTKGLYWQSERSEWSTLSSSPLRFAVYVGIIIVRASRGQRSSCLHVSNFWNYCSQDCWQVERESWLAWPALAGQASPSS